MYPGGSRLHLAPASIRKAQWPEGGLIHLVSNGSYKRKLRGRIFWPCHRLGPSRMGIVTGRHGEQQDGAPGLLRDSDIRYPKQMLHRGRIEDVGDPRDVARRRTLLPRDRVTADQALK